MQQADGSVPSQEEEEETAAEDLVVVTDQKTHINQQCQTTAEN